MERNKGDFEAVELNHIKALAYMVFTPHSGCSDQQFSEVQPPESLLTCYAVKICHVMYLAFAPLKCLGDSLFMPLTNHLGLSNSSSILLYAT